MYCIVLHRAFYCFSTQCARCLENSQTAGSTFSGIKEELFSSVAAAQNGVKPVTTKGGSILDLDPSSFQSRGSNNLDHLDLAIVKGSKRTKRYFALFQGKHLIVRLF